MKTQFYFLAPVEVVKVTNENLAEVAEWCGGKVAAVESRRVPGRMDSYVWVPTPKGNSISWAFPGMYITRRLVITIKDEMKYTFQVSRRDYFSRNYFETVNEAVDKTWEKGKKKPKSVAKPQAPAAPTSDEESKKFLAEHQARVIEDVADGKITLEQYGQTIAEVPKKEEKPVKKPALPKYLHTHNLSEDCADNCVPRETEGVHIYHDTRITNEQENDMERSKHGYPVLSEEEAAFRKNQPEDIAGGGGSADPEDLVTPEEGLENVQAAFPDAEIIESDEKGFIPSPENPDEGKVFSGDALSDGQQLDGGEIVQPDGES